MRRQVISIVSLAVLATTVASTGSSVGAASPERSTYLVTFVDGTNARAEAAQLRAQNYSVSFVYENLFPGVAVELPAAAAQALARNPRVALIEPDGIATISDTQTGATWGLDRVDQRALPLDTTFTYPSSAGTGVSAYILDTGILGGHQEFTGRMKPGYTAINDGRGTTDCNGHGTHVAGTVGGTVYGVAKKVNLVPVRVLDCAGSGTWSGVVAGMDWVAANHTKPAVANMSLGGGASSTVDAAVQRMVDAGVTVAVAAGNENQNACNVSPARATNAITVGSTTSSDARSSFSNFGSCVDIFAPGSSITSAWHTSTSATNTIGGTSMASPHVAGVAALILSGTTLTPAAVTSQLVNAATTGVVTSAGTDSPNRLLYSQTGPAQPQALAITTTSLPNATVNTAYTATLQATGGTSPYTWSATGLPDGLILAADGTITGTPTATGSFTLVVTATDAVPNSVTANVSLTVAAPKVLPGAFGKTSPVNGATGISRSAAVLRWATSANATSYRVCLSTSSACNTWYGPYTTTSITFSRLSGRTVYYWHVQALNADGSVLANGGTIWRFTSAR